MKSAKGLKKKKGGYQSMVHLDNSTNVLLQKCEVG